MKPAKNIEKLIKSIDIDTNSKVDEAVLNDVIKTFEDSKGQKLALSKPNIRRIIIKSRITKLGMTAAIIIAVFIGIHRFAGSIDLATIAFADISEAMKNMPWMHSVSRGFDKSTKGVIELWIEFDTKIIAAKKPNDEAVFWNFNEHKKYKYDPQTHSITIDYAYENNTPLPISSPVLILESMQKMFKNAGARIITKSGEYMGQKAQIQEISLSPTIPDNGDKLIRLVIEPKSKLLFAAQIKSTDSNDNTVVAAEATFDYPKTGPADIYDLGAPLDARIISNLPKEEYLRIWDNYHRCRSEATTKYVAVITHTNHSLGDIITMVDVDYKSGQNHRFERHFVFSPGQVLVKFWPEYKKQLGNSLDSLLAWSRAHYNNTGQISVLLHDGEYRFSTKRDDNGNWSKPSRQYSPGHNLMPGTCLGYLAWPFIGKAGHIIEDDYARKNNLICIERLQQGSVLSGNVTLPGRFVYYLDPEKDYMCRREVTEWRPDAEWQEDKNWLDGVEEEKIRDGSIRIEDVTEVIKAKNEHWYPKVIVVKSSGICKEYMAVPLRLINIKTVYLGTNSEFPEGIFEPNNLVPAGAMIRKPGDKTTFEKAIAVVDSRKDWPEPKELVKAYWEARAKKDYDRMAVLWPGSSTWNRELLRNEKPVEYVFGEPRKATGKNIIVPYAEKSYFEKHGKYNLKMWLTNEKSVKGRYYIISGN